MTKQPNQIWEAALGALELQVSKANYQTWLKGTVGVSFENDVFVIGTPNAFIMEWLEKRLRHLIKKTLAGIIGHPVEIQFEIRGDLARTPPADRGTEAPRSNGACAGSPFNPKYTFPNFVVGSCNRLAHAAALGVVENPGTVYNPLFIYGGVGLGKTHLLHAIGQAVLQTTRQVIYVTAEQFTNDFIAGIREKSTESFRNKYRSADVLLIDDIQFIAGKEQTQEGLFHTFNDLHTARRQIILSSDRPPKALSLLEDRLRSRFEWGLIVDIQPPDFETRVAILEGKAAEMKVSVPSHVLQLIARKVQQNIRELEGALNRVVAYARLTNAPITPEVAAAALTEIGASGDTKHTLTTEMVIKATAAHFALSPDSLMGKRRDKSTALARQVAMYLLREELNASWTEIGRALGGRDHSTVVHGHEKIALEIEASSALRREILDIKESLYSSAPK